MGKKDLEPIVEQMIGIIKGMQNSMVVSLLHIAQMKTDMDELRKDCQEEFTKVRTEQGIDYKQNGEVYLDGVKAGVALWNKEQKEKKELKQQST
jgi:hypothetical protein